MPVNLCSCTPGVCIIRTRGCSWVPIGLSLFSRPVRPSRCVFKLLNRLSIFKNEVFHTVRWTFDFLRNMRRPERLACQSRAPVLDVTFCTSSVVPSSPLCAPEFSSSALNKHYPVLSFLKKIMVIKVIDNLYILGVDLNTHN